MLLIHILIAISSIGVAGYTYFKPSKRKLNISYIFVGATLATGTYLVVFGHANLVRTCFTGIIYLAFVTVGLISTHKKLASEESKIM